ncbi:MAG: AAA family ATPase [Ignavibacteriales bacterium]
MTIERIDINNSFTKFNDNKSMDLSEGKNCIFIYGSNGTGKSSLSKLFCASNLKLDKNDEYKEQLHLLKTINSESDMSVIIWYNDETFTTFNGSDIINPKKIPVFNKYYIDKKITYQTNFKNNKFQEQSLNYGIELESKTKYNQKFQELEENKKRAIELSENADKKIENGILQTIKDTGTTKSNQKYINEYNFRYFFNLDPKNIPNDDLEELRDSHKQFILSLKDLNEDDTIKFNINEFINLEELKKNVININKVIKFNEDKSKLDFVKQYLDNFEVDKKNWKIQGAYFINDSKCPFCEQDTSNVNIVNMYKNYIESNLKKTEDFINNQIKYFENENKNIDFQYSINETKAKNIDKIFQSNVSSELKTFVDKIKDLNSQIIDLLKKKSEDENIYIDCTNSLENINIDLIDELLKKYTSLTKYISELNTKIDNSKKEKNKGNEEYLNTTGKYIVYNLVRDDLNEFKKMHLQSKKLNDELAVLKKEYQDEVKEKNELLKTINNILNDFSITNYRVNENFDLFLNDCEVSSSAEKLLSDGEKNIIAFALFLSELKLLYTNDEKDVIFIDDPITSVDYPNLYSMYNHIKDVISENINSQIIVTSHNTIFLNLFKFYYRNNALYFKFKEDKNEKTTIYKDTNILDSIYLEKLKEIYDISISKDITPKQKLYIHNYCRYVLETISRFEFPNYNSDSGSSQNYISELKLKYKNVENSPISKNNLDVLSNIVNKGSHATLEIVHDNELFDDKQYIKCCNTIIAIIKDKYNGQYNLLTKDIDLEVKIKIETNTSVTE